MKDIPTIGLRDICIGKLVSPFEFFSASSIMEM